MVLDKATTRYVSLMVTHKCNLNCVYCYEQFKNSKAIDIDDAKKYISKIFYDTAQSGKYKSLELSMMGGEPLLEFERIKEICEWMWSREWPLKYIVFASTNGTLLTERMKQWFYTNKDRFVLGISLDGTAKSQSLNRGYLASTIDIDFFVKTWPEQGIKATISKESIRNLADDVIFIHNKGFKTIYTNLAFGIDWEWSCLSVFKTQLMKLIDFYLEHPNVSRCSLLNLDLCDILDLSNEYKKYCGCGEGTVLVETDGKEYPCPVFSPITLPKERLETLSTLDFLDQETFIGDKCKKCLLRKSCNKCYGMSFLLTGNPSYVSSFNCAAYKIQVLANCILQEKLLKRNLIKEQDKEHLFNTLSIIKLIFNHSTIKQK